MGAAIRPHVCDFPIEHRGDGTEILFACRICQRSPAKALSMLQQTVEALEAKLHSLTKKAG